MIKFGAKFMLLIISTLIGVILLSIFSSFFLYSKVSELQVEHLKYEKITFLRQYEYELLRTSEAFNEAYPLAVKPKDKANFTNWFNVLWSRSSSFTTGIVGTNVQVRGLDIQQVKDSLAFIDPLVSNHASLNPDQIRQIKQKFRTLIKSSHLYQQNRDFVYVETDKERQQSIYSYYLISLILSSLTLFLGCVVSIFLYRKNKSLFEMKALLEDRVENRTIDLKNKNMQLKNEVQERYLVEEQLVKSQSEIEAARERALHQLNFDPLTQLASRSLFTLHFNQALIRAKRQTSRIGLLFLDLDRFKQINDTLGHSVGDELLKKTAKRIENALRQGDTAARFGGDEFAILLPEIDDINHVQHVVQRILKELSTPFILSGNESYISASIGIALYPEDGTTVEPLLRKADNAMYKAKDKGRNTYQFFTQKMEVEAIRRRLLETSLHNAVKGLDFTLLYQPIINLNTAKVETAEALIRWCDKEGKQISPATFIPIAEELGLISEIGEWVLRSACTEAVKWQNNHQLQIKIAVNLSSRQFQSSDLAMLVKQVLIDTGLTPSLLTLEITESLLMVDDKLIIGQLQRIRELGVDLAIDDFGTGYSSLSYLKKFPINILKIDRSFIQDLDQEDSNAELVKGILSMAKSLRLTVVAEGVEEQTQIDFLARHNCTYIQGFFYSKPLTSEQLVTFVKNTDALDKSLKTSSFTGS